jgi:hypothetical protein
LAVLVAVAITYQLARLQGHPTFRGAGNFFSLFTIQSNIIAATLLVSTALVDVLQHGFGRVLLNGVGFAFAFALAFVRITARRAIP